MNEIKPGDWVQCIVGNPNDENEHPIIDEVYRAPFGASAPTGLIVVSTPSGLLWTHGSLFRKVARIRIGKVIPNRDLGVGPTLRALALAEAVEGEVFPRSDRAYCSGASRPQLSHRKAMRSFD